MKWHLQKGNLTRNTRYGETEKVSDSKEKLIRKKKEKRKEKLRSQPKQYNMTTTKIEEKHGTKKNGEGK